MYVTFSFQMVPLLAAAVVGYLLASYGWRYWHSAGAIGFTLLALSVVEISLVEALMLSVTEPAARLAIQPFTFIGMIVAPTGWLAFVIGYTRATRHLSRLQLAAILAVEPAIMFALALTNSAHGLIWQSMDYDGQVGNGVRVVYGGASWFVAWYAYGAGALGSFILGWCLYRSRQVNWRQVAGLFLAILLAALGESGFFADLLGGLDPSPYVLSGSGLALYWGFLHYRLLELSSSARDAAFDSTSDGVIVLDPFGNVADANPIAAAECDAGPLNGRPVLVRARRLDSRPVRQADWLQYRDSPIPSYSFVRVADDFVLEDENAGRPGDRRRADLCLRSA